MKSVGFIDYYLDEWHANHYPEWIKQHSGGEYEVKYAYAVIDSERDGAMTNKEWAENYKVELLNSIDQLVKKSDAIIVLSPDNCEMHYELSKQALETGKCVYIDKTFAKDRETAEKIFAVAQHNNSPCFSSSALRFSSEYAKIEKKDIQSIISIGTGKIDNYIIHQIEPVIMMMGLEVSKVMYIGSQKNDSFVIKFKDERTATVNMLKGHADFSIYFNYSDSNALAVANDSYFESFIDALIAFFRTGKAPVSHQETITIMAVREACIKSKKNPGIWLEI